MLASLRVPNEMIRVQSSGFRVQGECLEPTTPNPERQKALKQALSILHISAADRAGGSARAASRIHEGLKRSGVQSRMLVGWKYGKEQDVALVGSRPVRIFDRLCNKAADWLSLQYLFLPSSRLLPFHRWVREADVIQLYNTHGGYFSHTILPALSRVRPVVWRLSDMWPMTGHCAYSFDCERWKTGCGSCPILSDYPELRHDRTALLWRIKQRVYHRSRLTLVAPSKWMAELARESPLLRAFPVHVIPNGLDTDVFHPVARSMARETLGIHPDRRVVLFSAQFLVDRRKGLSLLTQALERIRATQHGNLELLMMGQGADGWSPPIGLPVRRLGSIEDDRLLAMVYSAADGFVLPTLADNLPNSVLQSMACGTPVVSFRVGGVPEVVRHLETGYVAAYQDIEDLAHGIASLLEDAPLRARLGQQARAMIEAGHTLDAQAKRFIALYQQALEQVHAERVNGHGI